MGENPDFAIEKVSNMYSSIIIPIYQYDLTFCEVDFQARHNFIEIEQEFHVLSYFIIIFDVDYGVINILEHGYPFRD
jgi:hypothetical protein